MPVGSQEDPETLYKYNYKTGEVWKDTRADLTALGTYIKTQEPTWNDMTTTWNADLTRWDDVIHLALNPTPIFGDNTGVTTERTSAVNDNGSAIDSRFETKDFTAEDLGGEIGQFVRWTALQVWAKGDTLDIEYSTDAGTTYTNITTLTLAADYPTDASPLNGYFDVTSSMIRFRFSNDTVSETFSLKKFFVEAKLREMRR
ncbi:MAG: hypothetical protein HY548_08110 [Elusimicrobia bacterium]|nr:hypothetical protein [Elusimicrobiota bacterium]